MTTNDTRLYRIQLTYTIDGYDGGRLRNLPLMPNQEGKLYHPDGYDNNPARDVWDPSMDGRCSMGLEVEIWTQDHFWMFSCFCLLFLSSLDLCPV
jgi:hypothetical protein